jgi:hypothetical protein
LQAAAWKVSLTADVHRRVPSQAWLESVTTRGAPLAEVNRRRVYKILGSEKVDVVFSADGRWLASAGPDAQARVWVLMPAELVANACSRALRNLTCAEWGKLLGDRPYKKSCAANADPPDMDSCALPVVRR